MRSSQQPALSRGHRMAGSADCSASRACRMAARVVLIVLWGCAVASRAAQPAARIYLDLSNSGNEDVEKRYTPELLEELRRTRDGALLLYMEYTSQSASDVKAFIKNISGLTQETIKNMKTGILDRASRACREEFEKKLKKAQKDAHRAALFSGENHHKYLLGHMIVMRMHLNKSEDYIRRCEKIYKDCGIPCETTPKMIRLRRMALVEMDRVKDDVIHSRKSYKDLIIHNRRKLYHLRKEAHIRAEKAVEDVETCVKNTSC